MTNYTASEVVDFVTSNGRAWSHSAMRRISLVAALPPNGGRVAHRCRPGAEGIGYEPPERALRYARRFTRCTAEKSGLRS